MTERTKDVLWLLFVTAMALVVGFLLVAQYAKADYTIAFGASWCGPCRQMMPVEDQLRAEGQLITYVDIDAQPELARAYRVSRIPCFVRVLETPAGNYESGRITGACTAGQLRRLAVAPCVVSVGAAARSAVRAIAGSPSVVLPEW